MSAQDEDSTRENPAKSSEIQRGRPFARGTSGNPAGRPPGARNKATLLREEAFRERALGVLERQLEAAEAGDAAAARLVLARLLPAGRSVGFDMPAVETVHDVPRANAAVLAAVAAGEVTPREGLLIGRLLEMQMTALMLSMEERGREQAAETRARYAAEIQARDAAWRAANAAAAARQSAPAGQGATPGQSAGAARTASPGSAAPRSAAPRSAAPGAARSAPASTPARSAAPAPAAPAAAGPAASPAAPAATVTAAEKQQDTAASPAVADPRPAPAPAVGDPDMPPGRLPVRIGGGFTGGGTDAGG
jgi:hypothetical protein